jgi:YHS domain-containing protein
VDTIFKAQYASRKEDNYKMTEIQEYKTACRSNIKDPTKYPSAEYRGQQIYFCTRACLQAFEQDTEGFMTGEIEHPLDED